MVIENTQHHQYHWGAANPVGKADWHLQRSDRILEEVEMMLVFIMSGYFPLKQWTNS